ncbi:MAG: DUF4367 domain-containing protein [Oscillospiraceae bacterium]|jgi:hypothetical protein|nr:DUF4367 domain-containing protein [Oscillospiraceae bacterium]
MRKEPFTENELRCAFTEYGKMLADSLSANEELAGQHRFSTEFECKMQGLFNCPEKKKSIVFGKTALRRAAACVGIILIGASALTFSVKAVRTAVAGFFVETYEKLSLIVHIKDDEVNEPEKLKQRYEPSYWPDGYARKSEEKNKNRYQVTYSNDIDSIVFTQRATNGTAIDTESTPHEWLEVNGLQGIYYESRGVTYIVWEDAIYRFEIFGPINKDELLKMAESLELSDK